MAVFTKTIPTLTYHKFWQLEPLIRSVLKPKVLAVGSIHQWIFIHISHQAQRFSRIATLLLPAYPLKTLYALDLNVTFRY